jgi:hypothetical protein
VRGLDSSVSELGLVAGSCEHDYESSGSIKVEDSRYEGKCLLIEVSIPTDRNLLKKETETVLKYEDLIQIERMWTVKLNVMLFIIGAAENLSASFQKISAAWNYK